MVRSFPVIALVCAVLYLGLPMRSLSEAELQKVYSAWRRQVLSDDVVVLRGISKKAKADAIELRTKTTPINFSVRQREAGITDGGNIGEWSRDQLQGSFSPGDAKEIFDTPVSTISRVFDLPDGAGVFYLVVSKRKRSLFPFSSVRRDIEQSYEAYRERRRWTSWLLPAGPTSDDFAQWYIEKVAARHVK